MGGKTTDLTFQPDSSKVEENERKRSGNFMGYEIIRGPFLLMETVAMIHKYINGISFQSAISRQRFFMGEPVYLAQCEKMKRLQTMMEELCSGLDTADPRWRHYFAGAGGNPESICLAQLMTHPFCTLRQPQLREHAREICEIWKDLQKRGYWLTSRNGENMVFAITNDPGCPGDLFMQIKAMRFPGDFQMEMYECFRDFERSMWELVDLIEPDARALEERLNQSPDLFQDAERRWDEDFRRLGLENFVATFASDLFISKMSGHTRVAVLLMDSDLLTAVAAHSHLELDYNILYIGSAIPVNGRPRSRGGDVETVGNMLKCIGDKKRLEILRRLSRESSYGLELAEVMGVDSGHMSRILSQMHSYGFLQEEKDRLRVYYRTDREAIHNFLELVEDTIFPK